MINEKTREKLKQLRKQKKLTQADLGKLLGITGVAYGKYELGNSEPDIESLKRLSSFYNVSVDYLLNTDSFASKIGHPIVTVLDDDDPIAKAEYEEWLAENGGVDRQSTAVEISDAVSQLDEEQQKALLTILGSMLKK